MVQGKKGAAPMLAPSDEDKIWAGAFIDADGCIAVRMSGAQGKNGHRSIFASVTISQADPHGPILQWFQERWGGSLRVLPHRKGRSQTAWEWLVVAHDAYRFLDDVRPWLKIKGPRADNALLVRGLRLARGHGNAMTEDEVEMRLHIKAEANRLNARGV